MLIKEDIGKSNFKYYQNNFQEFRQLNDLYQFYIDKSNLTPHLLNEFRTKIHKNLETFLTQLNSKKKLDEQIKNNQYVLHKTL